MVKWSWVRSSISTRRGGDHVRSTQSRFAVVPLGRRGLRPANGQALAHSDGRGHSRHRTPHNHQSTPRRRRAGSRPSLQLSPRLLAAPLVVVALGPRPGRSHPAPLGPRGLRHAGRRRHRRRASRRPRLRQGAPPRPRPLDPQLHRLSLGPPVGRPGNLGPLPVRQPSLGPPRAGSAVSEPGVESAARRRHRNPAQLLRRLMAVLLHWFPHRHFTLTGDGGYGSHEVARFAHRHRRRLTLVSRFVPDAQLYTPPPVIAGKRPAHRPRTKGEKLPTPEATVAATGPADRTACNVSWYGGGRRDIEVVTATGNWYRSGE